ncbi:hypothetical protein PR202_gb03615 [Eleusine coracana subsp. coracana]|uniref:Uncharacterized protein n=1 Tax=Eleusine coracana subsp. coracana TaxID=191504 RepID=A0AAV5E2A3_ELECO|nr:hypothetical protein QOZ80_1BG0097950 [Eleusine coracana subsp. coracana]GJN16611.1 hypothetical protein PR202_gb03615 [Eleusine coracana subsp. coracana]
MGNAGSAPEQANNAVNGADADVRRAPPSTVRFVPEATGNQARQPPPIKLEEEEGAPPPPVAEEDMAPRNLWQVYALGAFIVSRWAWAKWKESQDRKDSPDGDSPDVSS